MRKALAHLAAAAALSAAIATAAPALAFDQGDIDYIDHYVQCKIWLLTGNNKHKRFCLPSHVPPENKTLSTPVTDTPFGTTRRPYIPSCLIVPSSCPPPS